MTVADLIRELQAMPNQQAPVFIDVINDHHNGVFEAAEADEVRNEGPYVQIRSK